MNKKNIEVEKNYSGLEIAVIGMSGRFPSAKNINDFWVNLKNGIESVSFFPVEELLEEGISDELVNNPNYVKAKVNLEGKEYFDSSFFGYTPEEAALMDPQTRLFHECVWESLENAGVNPSKYQGLIGLYAGAGTSFYWEVYSMISGGNISIDQFTAAFLKDKDNLPTRISYKLNLNGPAIFIKTTCSTALVAIHTACRGLLLGDCKIALAGGVTLTTQSKCGHLYQEGMINSKNGHCFAFDANATGTIWGEGAAVVVLKRLKHALEDRDSIWAVIRGSAINNDGERKVGFSAPSIDGQAEVIRIAQKISRVEPTSISYIETHGTATALGDPIEIEALIQAFGRSKEKYCGLGSVKTNIGHLDTAAGAAGFIKTVLALSHRQIPPSLHFEKPNPRIDFENSPFYVNTVLKNWENDGYPLRAGVSSFGIGGTNAHVILEEAPFVRPSSESRKYQMVIFSTKTAGALDKMTEILRIFFKENSDINLADAAFTLQVGRGEFPHRRMFVCKDIQEAIKKLSSPGLAEIKNFKTKKEERPVVFMFPGQGSQYVNMARGLYEAESLFREEIDRCFEILKPLMGIDLKEVLYPHNNRSVGEANVSPGTGTDASGDTPIPTDQANAIDQTWITQPIIFVIEYALAKLLMAWGIAPYAMIGHSIGEYTAACLAGVFSLEDALTVVAWRGKLMQQMPTGDMLSVALPEEELKPLMTAGLDLAAVNGRSHCVVSGSHETTAAFASKLEEMKVQYRKLHTSHAYHSQLMDPILNTFAAKVGQVALHEPNIPFISNVTGSWISYQDAVDPKYWSRHVRSTVRFAAGAAELLKKKNSVFIEVGPARTLNTFIKQHPNKQPEHMLINLVRNNEEEISDVYYLLERVGRLWLYGQKIDWQQFYAEEKRNKVHLPTYPFEKIEYPFGKDLVKFLSRLYPSSNRKADISEWFYVPSWKKSIISPREKSASSNNCNLVFMDNSGLGPALLAKFSEKSEINLEVSIGNEYNELSGFSFIVNPDSGEDLMKLFQGLRSRGLIPDRIIHLWSITDNNVESLTAARVQKAQILGFYSLLNIARAAGFQMPKDRIDLFVISNNMLDVNDIDMVDPGKSTISGAVKVIPQEYKNISCRCIDILLPGKENIAKEDLITQLYDELCYQSPDIMIAYRNLTRWVQIFDKIKLPGGSENHSSFREKGVYLITGGLGGMGLTFSMYLGKNYKARLILTGRSDFPARSAWQEWLVNHAVDDEVSKKILILQELENVGAEILYFQVDVAMRGSMEEKIKEAEKYFGSINGIIHAAGVIDYEGVIHNRSKEKNEVIFAPKIYGTLVLNDIFRDKKLDFFVLCSSISAIIGSFGEVGYVAANAFLDAFARYRMFKERLFTISINWSFWNEVGMGYRAFMGKNPGKPGSEVINGIYPQEGVEALLRIIEYGLPRLVVSVIDVNYILSSQKQIDRSLEEFDDKLKETGADRPELHTGYMAPSTTGEKALAELWQSFFGIKKIGINDDFFELGGDSLKAMNMVGRIQKKLDIDIPYVEFFNRSTIKELVEYIDSVEKEKSVSIINIEKKEYYHLSTTQERMYFLHNMGNRDYEISNQFEFETDIDKSILEGAFKSIIRRHESLRTSFRMVEDKPVQVIHDDVDFTIKYYEECKLSSLEEAIKEKKINDDFQRPFDLSLVPLMRLWLIKNDENRYLVLLKIHHIITDAISNDILIKDVYMRYIGRELPALIIQYKDFSNWQNRFLKSDEIKNQEEYWLNQFSGEIPEIKLPIDFEITGERNPRSFVFYIDKDEGKRLDAIRRDTQITMFMFMFAIYNILLSKLSGQDDIIVGTFLSGRDSAYIENIVGMFVKTLALRNYINENLSVRDFLIEIRNSVLETFRNQDYPFDKLVEKLQIKRRKGRNPLFDAAFNFFSNTEQELQEKDKEMKLENMEHYGSLFDMVLLVDEKKSCFEFTFGYNSLLFETGTIERFIQYFKEIYSTVVDDTDIMLSDIKISHQFGIVQTNIVATEESEFNF